MKRISAALVTLLVLSGCGGMTKAVGVLPNTTDDLARKSEAFRNPPERTPSTRTP